MKAFLITTCVVFGLITLAHIARVIAEGTHLMRDPMFVVLTLLSAGLSVWAWLLLRTRDRRA